MLLLNIFGIYTGSFLPLWRILLGILCVAWIINELFHLRISGIFLPLMFLILLFEEKIAQYLGIPGGDLAPLWVFLVAAFLLTVGTSFLLPSSFKHRFRKKKNAKKPIGSKNFYYMDCEESWEEPIENNMGSCEVFFTNTEAYNGNGILRIENNMGQMILHVPQDWHLVSTVKNNLGSLQIPQTNHVGTLQLTITGENNMGHVRVEFEA